MAARCYLMTSVRPWVSQRPSRLAPENGNFEQAHEVIWLDEIICRPAGVCKTWIIACPDRSQLWRDGSWFQASEASMDHNGIFDNNAYRVNLGKSTDCNWRKYMIVLRCFIVGRYQIAPQLNETERGISLNFKLSLDNIFEGRSVSMDIKMPVFEDWAWR